MLRSEVRWSINLRICGVLGPAWAAFWADADLVLVTVAAVVAGRTPVGAFSAC